MICAISKDNRDALEDFHVNALVTLMEKNQALNLNEYLGNFYRRLLQPKKDGSSRSQEQALSYIHISPSIIRQVLRSDPELETYFVEKGLDLTSLVKLDTLFTKSEIPLKTVQSFLGTPVGIVAEIRRQQDIVKKVSQTSGFDPASAVVGTGKTFKAMPVSANTTTGQEATTSKDSSGNFVNIPDPSKITRYTFQRKVINDILSGIPDSSQLRYPYGGIFLTTMSASKISDYKGDPKDIVFVITDNDSNILSLDKDGKLDGPREVMYYESRQVTKTGDTYSTKSDLAPVTAIVRQYKLMGQNISAKEAENIRQGQLKRIYDIQEHINKNPDSNLRTIITGGSLGYTNYGQSIRTPLSSVKFDSPLVLQVQQLSDGPFFNGAVFFKVKGLQDPILLQRNEIPSELISKIASTFVDDIKFSHAGTTDEVTPLRRLQLIKQYLNNTGSFMTTVDSGKLILHLNDSQVDLSDKETARKLITDYFTQYQSAPDFDPSKLSQDKKDKAVDIDQPGFESKLYQGVIVKFETSEGTNYDKYVKPAFNINNDFIKNSSAFNDYILEPQTEGSFLLKPNLTSYYDWLKKHTYINYELNSEGKILALNSYFTYQLTDEAKDKLYPKDKEVPPVSKPGSGVSEQGSADTQPFSEAVKSFIDRIKKSGLSKTIGIKELDLKATEEQISQAKAWYENHPMSKHLPFEQMFNIVNSEGVARFTMGGITLFKGSDFSDLYHEAWHGFSQGFMTKPEKISLYNELKKHSGSFTTHTDKRVTFKKASYLEIEEYLAEDFRKYILSDGKLVMGKSPVRNTLFRRILNFLKALFGNTTYAQLMINDQSVNTVKDLYEKLRVGNINEYTFSDANAIFDTLHKGIQATDLKSELSTDESIIAVNTIDSIFSTILDELNKNSDTLYTNHLFTTEKGRQIAYEETLNILKAKRKDLFWKQTQETNPQQKSIYQRNLDTLDFMISNFGDVTDPRGERQKDKDGNPIGLIAYHNRKSEFLSFEDKFLPEDSNTPESWAFKDGNEVSVYERGDAKVWYLLRGLHRTDPKGNTILNRLDFPELVDFSSVRRKLTRLLSSSRFEDMHPILIKNQERYPYIKQLLVKLGDPHSTQENTFNMWNSFFQTFNSFRIPLPTMLLDKQGEQFISKVGEAYGDHKIIQRQWSNNFTSGSTESEFIVRAPGTTPYLNIGKVLKEYPRVSRADFISFINDIGVPLDRNEDIIKEISTNPDYENLGTYIRNRLLDLQREKVPVNTLYDLFSKNVKNKYDEEKNESSRYDQLAKLQAKFSGLFSEQVSTPTGDTRSEYSLNQSITTVAKEINHSENFQDLLNTSVSYLDRLRNPWARQSKRLNSLYDFNDQLTPGKRRKAITYQVENLNGISLLEDGEAADIGSASSSSDPFTKFVMDLHILLQRGTPENPRHGEKSTSISTSSRYISPYSKDGKLWMDPQHFLDNSVWIKIYDSVVPYLYAEHERVLQMRNAKPGSELFNYPDYLENGKLFQVFGDILSDTTKDKLYSLDTPLEQSMTNDLERLISIDFNKYFSTLFDQGQERFSKAGFIADNVMNQFITRKKDNPFYGMSKSDVTNTLLKTFDFNIWIHNMESQIMHYGDAAQYKTAVEFNKRISMFSSTGDIFRSDNTAMEYINNRGMLYARSIGLPEKTFSSELGSAVMEDPRLTSIYLNMKGQIWDQLYNSLKIRGYSDEEAKTKTDNETKAYRNMPIGDAQGWITFDSYRALSILSDKWSDKQESLYQKIVQGASIEAETVLEYFPVRKYQYAGPLKTLGLPVMAGHKYSLMPLIPTVVNSHPIMKALHERMMRDGVDYALFQSGSKITTQTNQGVIDRMYSDLETRTFDDKPFTKNIIYLDFLKDQQNINSEYKGKATISTQGRKVLEEGLYENGKPLTQEVGKIVKDYEQSVSNLTEQKKKKFIKEVGWNKPETYGTITKELLLVIDRELARQDISDHEREVIQLRDPNSQELKYGDLSYHLSSEKIEKVLSSMINRILVRQKISGESLVQVSGVGWESEQFRAATPEERLKYGTNDLTFYKYNGNKPTSAAKCKIALQGNFLLLLKLIHTDGTPIRTRERLNEVIQNDNWLDQGDHRRMITITGTRIPVEEQNSMEFEEVWEFLPKKAGNIIIHSAEIVAKTGSDFDVDKVTMMMPNLKLDALSGEVILFRNHTDKEARFLYDKYKKMKTDLEKMDLFKEETSSTYDNLFQSIFGYSSQDLDQELTDMLLEEGKIKPFEEFFEQLNGTKSAENEFMWNAKRILEHPLNYASLVRPNGTFTLDPIAKQVRDHVTDYNPNYRVHGDQQDTPSFSRLNEYGYNHYVHQINKVAGEALAQAATDNTANVNFNRIGAHMSYSYMDKTFKAPEKKAIEKLITLHLPHNTMTVKGKEVISLSHLLDASGKERVSGNIAQMINLLLEIAKNDSAYYLQLNREVMPVLTFLNQAGVPIDHLIFFASQPIIRDYMNEIRLAKSPIAQAIGKAPDKRNFFQNKARGVMLTDSKYGFNMELYMDNPRTMEGIKKIYQLGTQLAKDLPEAFSRDRLLKKITSDDKSITPEDRAVLLHWFEIEDMAKAIRDIKMRMNFDTKRSLSAFLAMNKTKQIESLQADGRIPYNIVEKLLTESAISSLYIQPFMIDFLKPLFPIRSNKVIGEFLMSKMSSMQAMEQIEETFGDAEKFATRFFNDLMSYIFQNKLRDFKIGNITQYRNMNAQEPLDVQQIPYLKFGVFVKDNTMYYDMNRLVEDFTLRNYTNHSYKDRGLATISQNTFKTAKEFYNFVFEREYIRSYMPLSKVEGDDHYIELRLKAQDASQAYEQYIRDKALDNIGNGHKLFMGDDTYAQQIMDAINKHKLIDRYPILGILTMSSSKGKTKLSNLQLLDTDLTPDKVDAFHQVLKELGDVSISKVPDANENLRLSELFHRFSMVAFLQSGLSTTGSFSLVRLVPKETYLDFMKGATDEFLSRMNDTRLERFYNSFIIENKKFATRSRYKDYTAPDPSTGIRAVSINPIPIHNSGLGYFTYNPSKLTEKLAKDTVDNNPELVFIYDKSVDKTRGIPIGSTGHFSTITDSNRTLGLPTLTSYTQQKEKSLTDKTLEKNKQLIDEAVNNLKDLQDSGLTLSFSQEGYGQGLIGLKPDGTSYPGTGKPGLKTFLYLSQQLYQEFNFVNKNYDLQTVPKQVVQKLMDTQIRIPISFEEELSPGYTSRTHKNASADVTIALATDFTSAGERTTKSSVLSQKKKYIPIDVSTNLKVTPERVSKIVKELNSIPSELFGISLNIAGNGIYTMQGQYTQQQVDDFTYNLLKAVIESPELKVIIASIRTGGQTGFDEAGAKAGSRLGILTKILAPKRWAFRVIANTPKGHEDIYNEQQFKKRFEGAPEEVFAEAGIIPSPQEVLASKSPVSDNDVRELIKRCLA